MWEWTVKAALGRLAIPEIHADPFDRGLVARAQVEGAVPVSADTRVLAYPVPVLDVTR